jgi:hypothetical protein
VGAPASYITLCSDNLAVGTYALIGSTGDNFLNSYTVDTESRLGNQIPGTLGLQGVFGQGKGNSVNASGRVLEHSPFSSRPEDAVSAGRSRDGSSLQVHFLIGGIRTDEAYDLQACMR